MNGFRRRRRHVPSHFLPGLVVAVAVAVLVLSAAPVLIFDPPSSLLLLDPFDGGGRAASDSRRPTERRRRRRIENVALMGQFNYPIPVPSVAFWHEKWSEIFRVVQVRGPFDDDVLAELSALGIEAHRGDGDDGLCSPVINLARALGQYRNAEGIDGVIYLHDDGLLNLDFFPRTEGAGGATTTSSSSAFLTDDLIGVTHDAGKLSYLDPRDARRWNLTEKFSKLSFTLYPNETYRTTEGTLLTKAEFTNQGTSPLKRWDHWKRCLNQEFRLSKDLRVDRYRDGDGGLLFPPPSQADFLFVPIRHADAFVEAAEAVYDHQVFLECAFPLIVQWLRQTRNATVRTVQLCTTWNKKLRNNPKMVRRCLNRGKHEYGMYHPIKLSVGLELWGEVFDNVTFSSTSTKR